MNFKPEKKFGFGLMRLPLNNPDNAGDIDIEELKERSPILPLPMLLRPVRRLLKK